jgi:hypothetical protein
VEHDTRRVDHRAEPAPAATDELVANHRDELILPGNLFRPAGAPARRFDDRPGRVDDDRPREIRKVIGEIGRKPIDLRDAPAGVGGAGGHV